MRQERFANLPEMVAQRQRVRATLALHPGERALEVGCGNGLLTLEMAQDVTYDGHITGVDISPSMVAMAEGLCAPFPNVSIATADATRLPFEDGHFDVAAVVQCLCLVSDIEAAIAELFRVLRPGGRAVILDTDWDTLAWNSADPALMARMMGLYKSVYRNAGLPRTLSKLLRSAGFDLLSRDHFAILNWRFDPDSFSGHQIEFFRAIGEHAVSAAELDAWVESIHATAEADTYFFSLNRYVFKAAKP